MTYFNLNTGLQIAAAGTIGALTSFSTYSILNGCGNKNPKNSLLANNNLGNAQLSPLDIEGSYREYAQTYSAPLNEFVQLYKNKLPGNELFFDPLTSIIPQPLDLEGAFRLDSKLFYAKSQTSMDQEVSTKILSHSYPYQEDEAPLEKLNRVARDQIQKWHPGKRVQISHYDVRLNAIATSRTSERADIYHVDAFHTAILSIPTSQAPIQEDSIWITKDGKEVKVLMWLKEEGTLLARDTEGDLDEYLPDDLDHLKCSTHLTTKIIPGLFNKHSWTDLGHSLTDFGVALPYSDVPYMIPGDQQAHAIPPLTDDPNRKVNQEAGCKSSETIRPFLGIRYTLEDSELFYTDYYTDYWERHKAIQLSEKKAKASQLLGAEYTQADREKAFYDKPGFSASLANWRARANIS